MVFVVLFFSQVRSSTQRIARTSASVTPPQLPARPRNVPQWSSVPSKVELLVVTLQVSTESVSATSVCQLTYFYCLFSVTLTVDDIAYLVEDLSWVISLNLHCETHAMDFKTIRQPFTSHTLHLNTCVLRLDVVACRFRGLYSFRRSTLQHLR